MHDRTPANRRTIPALTIRTASAPERYSHSHSRPPAPEAPSHSHGHRPPNPPATARDGPPATENPATATNLCTFKVRTPPRRRCLGNFMCLELGLKKLSKTVFLKIETLNYMRGRSFGIAKRSTSIGEVRAQIDTLARSYHGQLPRTCQLSRA